MALNMQVHIFSMSASSLFLGFDSELLDANIRWTYSAVTIGVSIPAWGKCKVKSKAVAVPF
jgi:hypothetical protein